jgi:hypothetical protein
MGASSDEQDNVTLSVEEQLKQLQDKYDAMEKLLDKQGKKEIISVEN